MSFNQTGHLDCHDLDDLMSGSTDDSQMLRHAAKCRRCKLLLEEYPDIQEKIESYLAEQEVA